MGVYIHVKCNSHAWFCMGVSLRHVQPYLGGMPTYGCATDAYIITAAHVFTCTYTCGRNPEMPRSELVQKAMHTDICVDMHIDMCTDMPADMSTHMLTRGYRPND